LAKAKKVCFNIGIYIALSFFLLFALLPIYWLLITSIKTDAEIYSLKTCPLWIQEGFTLEQFSFLFKETNFFRWFINSLIVGTLVTIISGIISVMAAYSFARLKFRGSSVGAIGIFITYLVPPTLLFIPLCIVVASLGVTNTIWSLIITYPTFTIPFCTWLLMSYFKTIPQSLEECAMIDGASRWRAIFEIVLPLAAPGLATVFLFAFSLSWAQFIYPLAFISVSNSQVISTGVPTELIRGDVFYWGPLAAGALLGSLPIITFYLLFTKYFISGLTLGATKY